VGNKHDRITSELTKFLHAQPVFFVATAPLSETGHVNLSPKGHDTFRVVGPNEVMYLDLTGSGNETAAHVAENGRLTLMFCAFEGAPRIVRLFCRGRVVVRGSEEWEGALGRFPEHTGVRQIVAGQVEFVQTSCGFGVPEMSLVGERDKLAQWASAKGEDGLVVYRRTKNAKSLDGLPAPPTDPGAHRAGGE
jgi:hypothetical protein